MELKPNNSMSNGSNKHSKRKNAQSYKNNDKENQHTLSTNKSGGPVNLGSVAVAASAWLGASVLRLWRRQTNLTAELTSTRNQLQRATSHISELSEELDCTKEQLRSATVGLDLTIRELEQRTSDLKHERTKLEHAKGELGLTQSRLCMIERELETTKRSLSGYQNQLEKARIDYNTVAVDHSEFSPSKGIWAS